MLELKKTEDWAFFLIFLGGVLLIINATLGMIIYGVTSATYQMPFLDGFGWLTFGSETWHIYFGGGLNIVIGIFAILVGCKLFFTPFYNLLTKIDVIITGFIMFGLGIASFSLIGFLLVAGFGFIFSYRISVEGANNKTAK